MAEDNVNSQIVNDSTNTNILSKREKKLTVVAIIVFSLLIVILQALIAEAYINQHPVLEIVLLLAIIPTGALKLLVIIKDKLTPIAMMQLVSIY